MSDETHVVGREGIATVESPAGESVVVRASGKESGGSYDLGELTIPPGPGVTPMHIHHEMDEAMYVLEGELTVQLGDDRHVLTPGSYAMAPRGVPHTYHAGDDHAHVLFINSPGNNWGYLEAAAEHGPVQDKSDIERMLPILVTHGVEMVGPPVDDEVDDATDEEPTAGSP